MNEPIVHITGPNVAGAYNIFVDDDLTGFHAMSLSPEAMTELRIQLIKNACGAAAVESTKENA